MEKTVYSSELGPMNGKYDPNQGKLWIRGPWGDAWDMDRESAKELRAFLNQLPELDAESDEPKKKTFVLTRYYYGANIDFIVQAAAEGVQLLGVAGYSLKDYPGDRAYHEGGATYVFLVEADSPEQAEHLLDTVTRERLAALYDQHFKLSSASESEEEEESED